MITGDDLERVKILQKYYGLVNFFSQVPKSLFCPTFIFTFLISSRFKFEQIIIPRDGNGALTG